MRNRFRLAYAAVALAAAGLVALTFYAVPRPPAADSGWPASTFAPRRAAKPIPEWRWGRLEARPGLTLFTLGPVGDSRRKYEFVVHRIVFEYGALMVSEDGGKTFQRLPGEPMGPCGFHWQGFGVNAIVAIRHCVPLPDGHGPPDQAREWLRVENLQPVARIAALSFQPRRRGDRFAPRCARRTPNAGGALIAFRSPSLNGNCG